LHVRAFRGLFGGLGRAATTVTAAGILLTGAFTAQAYFAKSADLAALSEDIATYRLRQERRQLQSDYQNIQAVPLRERRPLTQWEQQRLRELEQQIRDNEADLNRLKK